MLKGLEQEQQPLLKNEVFSTPQLEIRMSVQTNMLRFSAHNEFHLHIPTQINKI